MEEKKIFCSILAFRMSDVLGRAGLGLFLRYSREERKMEVQKPNPNDFQVGSQEIRKEKIKQIVDFWKKEKVHPYELTSTGYPYSRSTIVEGKWHQWKKSFDTGFTPDMERKRAKMKNFCETLFDYLPNIFSLNELEDTYSQFLRLSNGLWVQSSYDPIDSSPFEILLKHLDSLSSDPKRSAPIPPRS
jgi:hypothetical protein